ncbi:zinc-dependent alcohol dehydrogenase family protein [Pengzhenrongella sicca]|uniref:Zinc-dependent alcohol dehydrogenase family protein n=1 Tax=Pengzhenrongella sicca TaxID=2819238 RepID=A0A8A4ZDS7_9MICO|nr:zinc-dependent alcohol dehydrogenase family protein [Pengzhenrongella sicca]QTE27858.1 zinc-dependent alcohol dehydrogenase family protein [Pengzhenrongella sicca]
MRATVLHGPKDVRLEQVPDPILHRPTDAIVRVIAACVCGSDLWGYRGVRPTPEPRRIGHELVGVVEAVGADVVGVRPGEFVIAPFALGDGTCANCRNGFPTSCVHGVMWGGRDHEGLLVDGAQAELVRVPFADANLVATPTYPADELIPSLLALSDVMGTGHHAAVSARVHAGSTVVVVGDGAVGLCAVLASRRLGATRIVAMSRHPDRQRLAREFGATDVVAERGAAGVAAVRELLGADGAEAVLECVGTRESMQQALDVTRPGGYVGYVGVPAGGPELPVGQMFGANLNVAGGIAPVRTYLPELLADVLSGAINPGRVFDLELPLADIGEAYAAMDERRAIKSLVRP